MQKNGVLFTNHYILNLYSTLNEKTFRDLGSGFVVSTNAYAYDSTKYAVCYGQMTKAHKARGLHKSNRPLSIKIKETVCKACANGEIDSYEGKE